MNQIVQRLVFYGLPTAAMGAAWAVDRLAYDRLRKCKSCHGAQYEPWIKANHAPAMMALKAGERAEAEEKAVRNDDAVYRHYKPKGILIGKPVASLHSVPRARYAT